MKTTTEVTAKPNSPQNLKVLDLSKAKAPSSEALTKQKTLSSEALNRSFAENRGNLNSNPHRPAQDVKKDLLRIIPTNVLNKILNNGTAKEVIEALSEVPTQDKLQYVQDLKAVGVKGLSGLNAQNIDAEFASEEFADAFLATIQNAHEAFQEVQPKTLGESVELINEVSGANNNSDQIA